MIFDKKKSIRYREDNTGFYMKKCLYLLLCVSNLLFMTDLHARDEVVNAPTVRSYNWETSDEGQKTIAVKMTITGILLTILVAVISATVPTDTGGDVTPFSGGATKNTILE